MAPVAEVPQQDIGTWRATLARLLADREHYEQLSKSVAHRRSPVRSGLSVRPFEEFLEKVVASPKRPFLKRRRPVPNSPLTNRSSFACDLRERAWLPYFEPQPDRLRLFCFPTRGRRAGVSIPGSIHLPAAASVSRYGLAWTRNKNSRIADREHVRAGCRGHRSRDCSTSGEPFAFYGHSMGALSRSKLTRALRLHGRPLPSALYVSGARAPQFRLNWDATPEPERGPISGAITTSERNSARGSGQSGGMKLAMPALSRHCSVQNCVDLAGDPLPVPVFCLFRAFRSERDVRAATRGGRAFASFMAS